jgi:hypothetical protein
LVDPVITIGYIEVVCSQNLAVVCNKLLQTTARYWLHTTSMRPVVITWYMLSETCRRNDDGPLVFLTSVLKNFKWKSEVFLKQSVETRTIVLNSFNNQCTNRYNKAIISLHPVMRNVWYGITQTSVCFINSVYDRLRSTIYGAVVCGDFSDSSVSSVADSISAGVHVFLCGTQFSSILVLILALPLDFHLLMNRIVFRSSLLCCQWRPTLNYIYCKNLNLIC